ncbi:MAG: Xaa-Pro peptidase family protein [Alphaproteobacteria bacterium]|jgi:Xaa-Pro dipeptidase|nr:Xaa-Pro peptidase family protein [Alphaproteobacteria bacterium]
MSTELKKAVQRESLTPEFPYMPKQEWEARIAKARRLMERDGLDALMVLNSKNQLYFFGSTKTYRNVYPDVGIIPREGPTTIVLESGDCLVADQEGYAENNVGYRGDTEAPTPTAADSVKLITEVMHELDLAGKTIGMDFGDYMWWDGFTIREWERFKSMMSDTSFVDATDLIWEMRMIKSEWEQGVMRHLHGITALGYRHMIENAAPGVNEMQLFYGALRIWIDQGIVDSANYTLSCLNAIQPFRDRVLADGDWIMLDGGPSYKGYCSDMQRFIRIGDPGPDFIRAAQLACDSMAAVEEILKPGVTGGQIWQASYAKIAEQEPEIWRKARSRKLVGWVGHGEGLNIHEPPHFVERSEEELREGMVVAVEVPSFHGSKFANMPEDTYIVTSTGFEKLSDGMGSTETYIKT